MFSRLMKGRLGGRKLWSILLTLAMALGIMGVSPPSAHAATNQFKGVNWADQRDNFVNGVIYVSGLSSSDTYSSASVVADRVVSQFMSIFGSNTVRMPINEATVSSYWGTYTGALDKALSKGNVIIAYWAPSGGKPADMTSFWNMWSTVVSKYGSNSNAYFEVINEPYGYSNTNLTNMYNDWLNKYSSVPRDRVVLDGAGYAQNVSVVGGDSRLNNTLLAVHDYSFFVGPPYTSESQWAAHLSGYVGGYASRTICTEWGAPMRAGMQNGVYYDKQNYDVSGGSYFVAYVRGISSELRTLGMGSVYWPGLRDGDSYSMTTMSGSGSGIALSLVNASGLDRLQYAWGLGSGESSSTHIRNAATGLYIDGMGRTANGSAAGQNSSNDSGNQQWSIEADGSYVRIKNQATGLYIDGMGLTANGSAAGQYSSTGSSNQQWSKETAGSNVKFKNRATGLYLDGLGLSSNGADLGQYGSSSSTNQQWQLVN